MPGRRLKEWLAQYSRTEPSWRSSKKINLFQRNGKGNLVRKSDDGDTLIVFKHPSDEAFGWLIVWSYNEVKQYSKSSFQSEDDALDDLSLYYEAFE